MSLSMDDVRRLKSVGFTDFEVDQLANATAPDGSQQPSVNLDSTGWQAAMGSRQGWFIDKIEKGWSEQEVINAIMNYYQRDLRRSPFDFLKLEYRPPKRIDYWSAIRAKKRMEIEGELGEY